MTRPLAAAAAVLVASALWISNGNFHPWALAAVTAAALAALAATAARPGGEPEKRRSQTRGLLGAGLAVGLGSQLHALHLAPGAAPHPYLVSVTWATVAVALSYALPRPPPLLVRWRFPLLLLLFLGQAAVIFAYHQLPLVDVWLFRQAGTGALAHGANPYQVVVPNIYGHDRFYGPAALQDGKVVVYPYPPLIALLDLPAAVLLGDVRWTCVAATIVAAALISRLGDGLTAELAGLLVLFQPRTLWVAEVSWTEPVLLACAAGTLLALRRWSRSPPEGWAAGGAAFGLLLASKQYTPLLALPLAFAAPRGGRLRAAFLAASVLAVTLLPFWLWNPAEFWRDVVVTQFLQPFRRDALSWLAAWARWRGGTPSTAIGFAAAGVAVAAGLRARPSLVQAAATASSAFLLFLLFNKQAFCNYYWLAAGLLAATAALEPAAPADDAAEPGA